MRLKYKALYLAEKAKREEQDEILTRWRDDVGGILLAHGRTRWKDLAAHSDLTGNGIIPACPLDHLAMSFAAEAHARYAPFGDQPYYPDPTPLGGALFFQGIPIVLHDES